jgi:cytochrome c peroxidase
MRRSTLFFLVFVLTLSASVLFSSFRSDNPNADLPKNDTIKFVVPKGWPKPVYDFAKNPVTKNGFELGRKLFFDPLLSKDSTISCASCHLQFTNYTHVDHALSHGIYGKKGTRNTQSIINTAWNKNFMWDGGINNIEVQPLGPIENPVEMDTKLEVIVAKLRRSKTFPAKFKNAFGSEEITGQLVLKALAQYMVSIESYNSKYDKVMRKEPGVAFNQYETKGLALFRKHCASCHTEPLFTNGGFENNGLAPDSILRDGGRIKITRVKTDSLKFKVPSLRNIEVSYPYMHDGRYRNLQMVLFHYSNAIAHTENLSPKLKNGIALSEEEKNNLIAFLKTLTDEEFLRDPRFYYVKE